jgi:hypothetical protein
MTAAPLPAISLITVVHCRRAHLRSTAQPPGYGRAPHAWAGQHPVTYLAVGQISALPGRDRIPGAPCGGTGQETAALTSWATFRSTAGLHSCSANDTGHRSPSSRFAASWNSSVEYRVLNLPEFLKQTTILPSALA